MSKNMWTQAYGAAVLLEQDAISALSSVHCSNPAICFSPIDQQPFTLQVTPVDASDTGCITGKVRPDELGDTMDEDNSLGVSQLNEKEGLYLDALVEAERFIDENAHCIKLEIHPTMVAISSPFTSLIGSGRKNTIQ